MAIIRTSALIGAISGKLGSTVFAHSNTGRTIRSLPRTIKHHSPQALRIKAHLGTAHALWPTLTTDEYNQWTSAAEQSRHTNRLAETRPMTAHQYFLKQNLCDLIALDFTRKWIPTLYPKASFGSLSLSFTAGAAYYVLIDDPYPATPWMLIAASRPIRSTPTRTFKNWRIVYSSGRYGTPGNDISTGLDATLGAPAAGEVIGIAIRVAQLAHFLSPGPWFYYQTTMS